MRNRRSVLVGMVVLSAVICTATAQMGADQAPNAQGGEPVAESFGVGWPADYAPEAIIPVLPSEQLIKRGDVEFPGQFLPALDESALLAEDEAEMSAGGLPRAGLTRALPGPVAGKWHDLPDGGRLWTAAVVTEGALELRVHFSDMELPAGAKLYVYSPQAPEDAAGPYAGTGPHRSGQFWGATVAGDTAYVEYFTPDAEATAPPFQMDKVGHMYRAAWGSRDGRDEPHLDCMPDIVCYPDWLDVSYGVARIRWEEGGSWHYCTGQLLASQNSDLTPYFLTSAHCVWEDYQAEDMEFLWFYQMEECGGPWTLGTGASTGALLLGTSGWSGYIQSNNPDWSLLMVQGTLPSSVYWVGWTNVSPDSGTWSVGVHHPDISVKRYSRAGRYYHSGYPAFHQMRWDVAGGVGQIYEGSSGSGIYREDTQQLFGNCSWGPGESGCLHLSVDAYYGKFSLYYSSISGMLAGGPDDALEDNDDCASAVAVAAGTYSRRVVKSTDEDWYSVTIAHNQELTAAISHIASHGHVDAELYDACGGNLVATSTGSGEDEQLVYANFGASADFYLRVFLFNDTRNVYDLDIALGEACLEPTITLQPVNGEVCEGGSTQFSVATDIPAPAYQWRRGSNPLVDDGLHITGATTDTLTIANVELTDASSSYNCLVTNTDGDCDTVSDYVSLTVNPLPLITAEPEDQVVNPGSNVSMPVVASGSGLTYQWYKDGEMLYNDGHFFGATAPTLLILSAQISDSGYYHVIITNDCGPVQSRDAHLIVGTAEPQACCFDDGTCMDIDPLQCTGLGGWPGFEPNCLGDENVNGVDDACEEWPPWCPGDMDCDGDVDFDDIDPFVLALGGPAGYYAQFPNCNWLHADCDGTGDVDFDDIDAFVALIGTDCPALK